MATSTAEFKELVSQYKSVTAASRAADNADPKILSQITSLKESLAPYVAEGYSAGGYDDAASIVSDLSRYESLIQKNIDNPPKAKEPDPAPAPKQDQAPSPKATGTADDDQKTETKDTKSNVSEVVGGKGIGLPNRRPYNPLSEFSSYNYQLSLYMVTPEASNRFIESGNTQVGNVEGPGGFSNGFYLVAQSGGINNQSGNAAGGNSRAPGFELDFYIDDLRFKTQTTTKVTGNSSAASIDFEFNIYEPYGMTFATKLKEAARKIQSTSSMPGFKNQGNTLAQFYMLGIRFFGYDKTGAIVTADQYAGSDMNNSSSSSALFERFYPIKISKFNFKLDGKMVVYNVKAACLSLEESYGSKRGQVNENTNVVGATVKDMIEGGGTATGLLQKMNATEEKEAAKRRKQAAKNPKAEIFANTYKVKFEPGSGIDTATMTDPGKFGKLKPATSAPGKVKKKKDSNAKAEGKNLSADKNSRTFSVAAGTHMVAAIEQIIKQSSYIKDMMTEVDSGLMDDDPTKNGNPKEAAWFSITPGIKAIGFDTVLNDYCYEITYNVQKYNVPFVRSALISKTSNYPGPHKKYGYWYTGKNSEIISYELVYNNNFFMPASSGDDTNPNSKGIPKKDKPQPANTKGEEGKAAEAVNSLAVDLFDPSATVSSKVVILGDPDYLSQTIGVSMSDIYDKHYGPDGYTINPNGGQVFVEIDFNTVNDFGDDGLLTPSGDINYMTYEDPGLKQGIKGMTYELKWVTSTFAKGKFTQELDLMAATSLAQFDKTKPKPEKTNSNRTRTNKKTKPSDKKPEVRQESKGTSTEYGAPDYNNYDAMGNYTGEYNVTAPGSKSNSSGNSASSRAGKQTAEDDNSDTGRKTSNNPVTARNNQEASRQGNAGRGRGASR